MSEPPAAANMKTSGGKKRKAPEPTNRSDLGSAITPPQASSQSAHERYLALKKARDQRLGRTNTEPRPRPPTSSSSTPRKAAVPASGPPEEVVLVTASGERRLFRKSAVQPPPGSEVFSTTIKAYKLDPESNTVSLTRPPPSIFTPEDDKPLTRAQRVQKVADQQHHLKILGATMLCHECQKPLPSKIDEHTRCSSCKILVSTWWDVTNQSLRTNRETMLPNQQEKPFVMASKNKLVATPEMQEQMVKDRGHNTSTIEERLMNVCLIVFELHFEKEGKLDWKAEKIMGMSMQKATDLVERMLQKTLTQAEVRGAFALNVDMWMHFRKIFNAAIPVLERRSIHQPLNANGERTVNGNGHDNAESAELILLHHKLLLEDLHILNSLLIITRNMLAIKETAQEICAAVHFDESVQNLIVLCVDVTSKGYDGETVDEEKRIKLNEITEIYKKVLVTCLQHTHNWTMGNDRFKMSFWFEMLFDEQMKSDSIHELPPDDLVVENVYQEVSNWLRRHNKKDPKAKTILDKYISHENSEYGPGPLPRTDEDMDDEWPETNTAPIWKADMDREDKFEQDRLYARVSHEIDIWWKKVRDPNFDGWQVKMATVEEAMEKADRCRENAMNRYMPQSRDADQYEPQEQYDQTPSHLEVADEQSIDNRSTQEDNGEEDEDDEEDDDSYVEGPLRGLLTEIPNILDTKQIEALHMTVKACIVDSMGSGLTPAGENLQKTRCKMFLALDCGKNLLRELLVFIAVWEQNDTQFIFQITAQIIESFHHNALLPYAWDSLRILKDIVSPAQTVLLRLINYMFRARKDSPIYADVKDYNRDAKLIHFLYKYFRERVVPDCLALIHAQAQIRQQKRHQSDFPVDLWDMERAKDGLSQYLDFISVIAEIPEMRHLLIEWEAVYELVALLKALEAGVARKGLVDPNVSPPQSGQPQQHPPLHDTPHKFPWTGIKIQVLIILTSLIAPTNARRSGPGNPIVQKQLIAHDGIMPLLNCCVYDGHNEYLKERATLTIKFLMEGCKEAQDFVKELVPMKQAQAQARVKANSTGSLPTIVPGGGLSGGPSLGSITVGVSGSGSGSGSSSMAAGVGAGAAQDVERKIKELERNMKLATMSNERNAESSAQAAASAAAAEAARATSTRVQFLQAPATPKK